ncbi:MAG: histidinol-phosphatase [Firmicutes bacterium]|nr:histidinol-phosphatase [Bacillota bacterium]MCM1401826.1 histidinol-phosphatase [Bacteroides sp.]MCM1477938.1 histidinol-phosphatase [Bacteroides sp.]
MIDFKKIAQSTDRYNFHSHTQFCDGRATMARFAEAVSAAGFRHWGFSPHSPVPVESPCNMKSECMDAYLAEMKRLNTLYGDKVRFYSALEIDYLGPHWGPSNPYFNALPLDYRIGSIHFIPTKRGEAVDVDGSVEGFKQKLESKFGGDIEYVVNTFYDQTLDMIAAGGFDIIGHFDKISHNASQCRPGIEHEAWYEKRLNEVFDAIIASGVVVEINTKSRARFGRFFPHERLWGRLKNAGVTLIVNSDAHHLELIDASRSEALEMLRNV